MQASTTSDGWCSAPPPIPSRANRRTCSRATWPSTVRHDAVDDRDSFLVKSRKTVRSAVAHHNDPFRQSVRAAPEIPGHLQSCRFATLQLACSRHQLRTGCGSSAPIRLDVDITALRPRMNRYPLLNLPAPPAGKPSGHPLTQVSILAFPDRFIPSDMRMFATRLVADSIMLTLVSRSERIIAPITRTVRWRPLAVGNVFVKHLLGFGPH